jgi:hypothetical protein
MKVRDLKKLLDQMDPDAFIVEFKVVHETAETSTLKDVDPVEIPTHRVEMMVE